MGRARDHTGYQDSGKRRWFDICAAFGKFPSECEAGESLTRLQITNSAPNHRVLGTLNGLAQTLSAAGRAVGPFISGSLFTAATKIQPKGEALAFGVFAGVSFVGFLLGFGIRGNNLEADGWSDEEEDENDQDEEEEVGGHEEGSAGERARLIRK